MDRFFDCLDTRNLNEADRTCKPDLQAYTQLDDPRFDFLEEEFLAYLEEWQTSVNHRPGQFSKTDRQKMCLTHQTFRGLVMTVHAFVGVTKYLLSQGVPFVLSNKFCQDPIEEHFGRHRGMGRTADVIAYSLL
ncbi:hypothetical protein BaRGS_00003748 [Batillaria attramentaria]|uniref:Uncharacterized protein n=1 Tax=Batillaria attramentaria TaxID=370345 RepID=A0ABD0M0D9_9CAEN